MILGSGMSTKIHSKVLKRIKVAIYGLGSIGKKHLKKLNEQKKYIIELTYLNLQKSNKNKDLILNYPVNLITNKKLIKNDNFDLLLICTPSYQHIHDLIKLNKYSKNIFIEKPLSLNSEDLSKIKDLKNFYVGYVLNHKKILIKAKSYLKDKLHLK